MQHYIHCMFQQVLADVIMIANQEIREYTFTNQRNNQKNFKNQNGSINNLTDWLNLNKLK